MVWPPKCEDCKYFERKPHGNTTYHECRRNPPAYTSVQRHIWPGVQATDWCGEFKKSQQHRHKN